MPRLYVWVGGAAAATAGAYVGYYGIYLPRLEAQKLMEEKLFCDKLQSQRAMQAYGALLKLARDKETQMAVRLAQDTGGGGGGGGEDDVNLVSHFFTNELKLYFYLEIQRVKSMLYRLPRRAQSERDKRTFLDTLDALEVSECGALNFRPRPLTWVECLQSAWCCLLYVAWFRVVYAVIDAVAGPAGQARWAHTHHRVAKHILHGVDVAVVMSVHIDATSSSLPSSDSGAEGGEQQGSGSSSNNEKAPVELCVHAQHWIEEVAFWASSDNPLVQACAKQQQRRNSHNKSNGEVATPIAVRVLRGPAGLQPYERHWAAEEAAAGMVNPPRPESAWPRTFGYPLLPRLEVMESTKKTEARVCPVVAAGTPLFLYMNEQTAVLDEIPRIKSHDIYQYIQKKQFPNDRRRGPSENRDGSESESERGRERPLLHADTRGVPPDLGLFSRPFWFRVRGQQQNRRRMNWIHVRIGGAGATPEELVASTIEAQLDVSHRAYREQ